MGESQIERAALGETAVGMAILKTRLREAGVAFSEEASGRLAVAGGPDEYLIEVAPDGVRCLFGVDMEELRLLVSGSGNEDLGEDELQRVAREQVRPLVRRYQPIFAAAGFQEEVVVDAGSYAVAFVKPTAGFSPSAIVEVVRWCCRAGRPPRLAKEA
ncbi:MAG TPA: hypothetical protein VLY45_03770 [Nitrospiria bacterium]|nr:hypothetical protein [Nitrospiria bacterium]